MGNIEDQRTDQFKPFDSEESELAQWLEEGSQRLAEKQFREAIKLFEKVLRVDPDNMAAFEKLSLARSIQADMDHIAEYLAMGQELMSQHDWKGAQEEFHAVLSIDPKNEEAVLCLREVQGHLGLKGPEADVSAITTGGENVFDLDSVPETGSYSGASNDDQETAILATGGAYDFQNQETDPEFQRQLEEALRIYEAGNLPKAKSMLEQLQNENPGHAQIQFYLTAISRRFETESVRKDQTGAETLFKQGMDQLEKQKFDEARASFQAVLQVRPDFNQAQLMLERIDTMAGATRSDRGSMKTEVSDKPSRFSAAHSKKPSSSALPPKPKSGKSSSGSGPGINWLKILLIAVPVLIVGLIVGFLLIVYPNARYEKFITQAKERVGEKAYLEAISLLESALVVQPDSLEALELLGEAATAAEKPDKAVTAYESALRVSPEDKDLILQLGTAQFNNKQWADSEMTFKQLVSDILYQDEATFKIAMSLKNRNNIDAAILAFQNAISVDEANSKAHYELAQCYELKQMFPEAEASYHQAISTDPKFVLAYEKLGNFYKDRQQYEQAAEILKRLLVWFKPTTVEKSNQIAQLRFKLGEMQYESGDYTGAVESFTTVIQIEPNVDAFRNLGRAHYKNGKLTEAILVWRRGIELDNKDHDLWFQIGTAQLRQGDTAAAESSYQESLRLKPNFVKALTNLGFLYHQTYRFDMARKLWKQSLELDPDQPTVKDKLKEIDKK